MSRGEESFSHQLWSVAVIFFSMLAAGTSLGMNTVAFPITLKNIGCSNIVIGGILSLEMVAILLAHVILPRLDRVHTRVFMLITMVFRIIALLIMPFFIKPAYWGILIIIHGFGMFTFLMLLQSWLNAIPIQKCRGLLMSTWGTALSIGLTIGPILVGVAEKPAFAKIVHTLPYIQLYQGHLSFLLSVILSFIAMCPVFLGWKLVPMLKHNKMVKVRGIIKSAPVVMAAALLVGCSIFGVQSFITLYGMMNSLSMHDALLLLSAFMFGAFTLEAPIAMLSDIFNRERVMIIISAIGLVCAAFLPIVIDSQYQSLLLLYIWGGVDSAMFSISLATLSERFKKDELIIANSTFFTINVLGGALGAFMIGAIMEFFQSDGLPYTIMIATALYIAYSLTCYGAPMTSEEGVII